MDDSQIDMIQELNAWQGTRRNPESSHLQRGHNSNIEMSAFLQESTRQCVIGIADDLKGTVP
jgi:hypothetical protein